MTPSSTPDAPRPSTTSLYGRISELENLVVNLMKDQSLRAPLSPRLPSATEVFPKMRTPEKCQPEAASPAADPGTLSLHESGTSYIQDVHWEAILTKIKGLREDLVSDSKAPFGSHLFYGPNRHATRDDILFDIYNRRVEVDRLMALHFDSYIVTPCQYIQAFGGLRGIDCVLY